MASSVAKPVESKQLADLLQEQQEPFVLDVYLHERGCSKSKTNSKNSLKCCYGNSRKFLKRSASRGLNRSTKIIPNCSNVVKSILGKFVYVNFPPRMENYGSKNEVSVTKSDKETEEVAKVDRFSSASGTTVFNSCSEGDSEDKSTSEFATIDNAQALKDNNLLRGKETEKLQWRCVEDNKQLSPVSVLDEILSEEGSPFHNKHHNAKTREVETPSTSSTSDNITKHQKASDDLKLCKLLVHSELFESKQSSQYLISKRVLQQNKQLLLECVREVLDTHVRKETGRKWFGEFLGPEDIETLLLENLRTWTKHPGNETNLAELLDLDFLASVGQWTDFRWDIRKFGTLIGDSIFEDIINEVVADMIEEDFALKVYFVHRLGERKQKGKIEKNL